MPLAAMFLLLPLLYSRSSNDFFKIPKTSFFEICSFVSFALFVLYCVLKKTALIARPAGLPLLAISGFFLLINAFSLFVAQSPSAAFKDLLYFSCMFCLIFVLVHHPAQTLEGLFAIGFLSCTVIAGIGILQHFGYDVTGISTISGVPSSFMAATLGHRNYLAELLCIALPLGLAFYLAFEDQVASIRLSVFSALCLMYFTLLLTNSRSGLFAFTISTLFFCFVYAKNHFPLLPLPQLRARLFS